LDDFQATITIFLRRRRRLKILKLLSAGPAWIANALRGIPTVRRELGKLRGVRIVCGGDKLGRRQRRTDRRSERYGKFEFDVKTKTFRFSFFCVKNNHAWSFCCSNQTATRL
jgi:hypothetical protein